MTTEAKSEGATLLSAPLKDPGKTQILLHQKNYYDLFKPSDLCNTDKHYTEKL